MSWSSVGTLRDWADLRADRQWSDRVDELGAVAASANVAWLTLRPYEPGERASSTLAAWHRQVGGCCVIVDPSGDGRQRFADAMGRLDPAVEVNEVSVAAALYEPADERARPGGRARPGDRSCRRRWSGSSPTPSWSSSRVAWRELGWPPICWSAMDDFAGRRRRFGGLDDEMSASTTPVSSTATRASCCARTSCASPTASW